MQSIYEAHAGIKAKDFDTMEAACQHVEKHGEGYVVTFIRGFDGRDRSCAMTVLDKGAIGWRDVSIHE